MLKSQDFDRVFVVHVDGSEEGVGAFLAQPSTSSTSDQDIDIVAYYSQRHYSVSVRVFCGSVAITHCRPFLFGKKFTVH